MKVPLSWLREYVAVDVPLDELAERVDRLGREVERIIRRGVADEDGNLGLYRVGRVLEAGKHPNADRLQLCRVDVGESGAAPDRLRRLELRRGRDGRGRAAGRRAPGRHEARAGQAPRDGLGRDDPLRARARARHRPQPASSSSGEPIEPGTPLADVLPLGEVVLELEMTPNRPDLPVGLRGRARGRRALRRASSAAAGREPGRGRRAGRRDDRGLRGLPALHRAPLPRRADRPSPPWLKARLTAAGMRPISNVVDVTNYVMLALGNPLHAFDFDTLRRRPIVVRRARQGEEFTTLDGTERKLDPADLVIADAERRDRLRRDHGRLEDRGARRDDERPPRGGELRAGRDPASSERHALRTEGSNRWEKGVDPYLADAGRRLRDAS